MTIGDYITIGVAALGFVLSVYTAVSSAKKTELEILRGIIAELRVRVEDLTKEVAYWQGKYNLVCDWIRSLGFDPDDAEAVKE